MKNTTCLPVKSEERLKININQKKISNVKVKRPCLHYVFVSPYFAVGSL